MKKQTESILFFVAIIAGVLSLYLNYTILPVILGFACLAYLALGWHLFNPEKETKFIFVYFWIGYSFSTAFLALMFVYTGYPLLKLFQYGSISMLVIAIILMLAMTKVREKGVGEVLIKTVLLLGLVVWSILV
jgi:hypothetical protein